MPNPDADGSVTILDRDQLRAKAARGEPFKLVMVSSDWGFRAKHLPGSIHFKTFDQMFAGLSKDDDIVVYCSNQDCHASLTAIQKLREHGYTHISHYPGGLIDWESAGLPIEGDWT